MDTLSGSLSILENPAIIKFIFQGVLFTIIISIIAVLFSIVFGTVLALMRNYLVTKKVRIIKFISVAYIELFRNTPLLFCLPAKHRSLNQMIIIESASASGRLSIIAIFSSLKMSVSIFIHLTSAILKPRQL